MTQTAANTEVDAGGASGVAANATPDAQDTTAAPAPATQDAGAIANAQTTAVPATAVGVNAAATTQAPARTATTQVAARPMLGQPPSAAGSLGGTVFALILVVSLILALGWLLKRMPGFARGGSQGALRLVASLPVGARERVVVVDVGGTQLLLGVGAGGVRTLHTLETPLPLDDAAASPQFAQLLAQHFGKKA